MGGLVRVARRPYPRPLCQASLKGGGCDTRHPCDMCHVPRGTYPPVGGEG